MSNACRIRHVVMPLKRRSTGKRRSRVMRNLHTKRRRHSRGRGKKQSRRRHSRGRGKKHSRKHRRKHYVHHHKHTRNIGRAPLLDSMALRDIIIGNKTPETHILASMPDMERLHNLLKKLTRKSHHGFKLSKRKEIYGKLIPQTHHTDEETHSLQRKAMASIVKDLEAMGLKTPTPPSPLVDRKLHKFENDKLDTSMGL